MARGIEMRAEGMLGTVGLTPFLRRLGKENETSQRNAEIATERTERLESSGRSPMRSQLVCEKTSSGRGVLWQSAVIEFRHIFRVGFEPLASLISASLIPRKSRVSTISVTAIVAVVGFVSLLSSVAYAQVVPFSPNDEEEKTNSFDYQYRLVDADNAMSLGVSAAQRGDFAVAKRMLEQAVQIYQINNAPEGMAEAFMNLAFVAEKERNFRTTVLMIRNASKFYRDAEAFEDVARSVGYLGGVFDVNGRRDLACNSWDTAYEYYKIALLEAKAEQTLRLSEANGCPEVVKHRSADQVFPKPLNSAETSEIASSVASILGAEVIVIANDEEVQTPSQLGSLATAAVPQTGLSSRSSINEQSRRVLVALRRDALRGTAQQEIERINNPETSQDEKVRILASVVEIYRQLDDDPARRQIERRLAEEAIAARRFQDAEKVLRGLANEIALESGENEEVLSIRQTLALSYASQNLYPDAIKEMEAVVEGRISLNAESAQTLKAIEDGLAYAERASDSKSACGFLRRRLAVNDKLGSVMTSAFTIVDLSVKNCAITPELSQAAQDITPEMLAEYEQGVSERFASAGLPAQIARYPVVLTNVIDAHRKRQSYWLVDASLRLELAFRRDVQDIDGINTTISRLYENASQMANPELVDKYRLQQRTAELDVRYANAAPADLGNLGLDSAQSGDVEVACYFWQRAFDAYSRQNQGELLSVINVLRTDYGCQR